MEDGLQAIDVRRIRIVLSLVLIAGVRAGASAREEVPSRLVLRDSLPRGLYSAMHDIRRVELRVVKGELRGEVVFARTLREGIFTCVHLMFDVDDDARTGLQAPYLDPPPRQGGGWDLAVRFAVGARYRCSDDKRDPEHLADPMDLRFAGCSVENRSATAAKGGSGWQHGDAQIPPPTVHGETLGFSIPLRLFQWSTGRADVVRLFVVAEARFREEPVSIDCTCDGQGRVIRVDGSPGDWKPTRFIRRPARGLRRELRHIDLTDLWVEHSSRQLFACVRLAAPGFTLEHVGAADFDDTLLADEVVVAVEPLGAPYATKPLETRVSTWSNREWYPPQEAAVGEAIVEFGFARYQGEDRFRVTAWTEARRFDHVPDAGDLRLRIPPEAWQE